jgi:hypothetical protein
MKLFINALFLCCTLMQCKTEDQTALLIGDWKAVSWSSGGVETSRDAQGVSFSFSADGRYTAQYASEKEAGNFRLSSDKLYTTADAPQKIEKAVRLSKISADTLIMEMNRTGQPEQLILVKK